MGIAKKLAIKYVRTKLKLLSAVSKQKAAQEAFELFITPPTRVKKEPSLVFKTAEQLSFRFAGKKVYGYRFNHPSQKKLLILHGFESSVINFEKYINPLIKKGYEIIAFDAPAHGRSEGKQINAIDYKNFVLHVMKGYGPITSFITHSFGGLALSLALEEIRHDESWKVVFIAPATESVTAMDNFFEYLRIDDKEVKQEFEAIITEVNQKPLSWYSVSRAAENIKAQVLFLQDRQDNQTPLKDVDVIINKGYPNFHFIISDGLGHSKIYRDAATVQAIIDFL